MSKFAAALQSRLVSLRSEDGNAAEYGLIIAGVAVVIIVAVFALGGVLNDVFTDVAGTIENGPAGG